MAVPLSYEEKNFFAAPFYQKYNPRTNYSTTKNNCAQSIINSIIVPFSSTHQEHLAVSVIFLVAFEKSPKISCPQILTYQKTRCLLKSQLLHKFFFFKFIEV